MEEKLTAYNELTDEAFNYIKHICDIFGPRISGTNEEKEALNDLEKNMKEFADFTYFDTYKLYPTFYPGGIALIFSILVIISSLTFFLRDFWIFISMILPILALFVLFISLVKMKYWFALFAKKGISHNATARILPKSDHSDMPVKKKVIIAGHMDRAFQMRITRFGEKAMLFFITSIIYAIIITLLSIVKLIQVINLQYIITFSIFALTWIDIIHLVLSVIFLPVLIITVHGFSGGKPVLGANDNLSGVAVALVVGKYFSQKQNRLKNTEIWIGAFGSEECGERGSDYFIKKYKKMDLLDNCIAIIPESVGAGTHLAILTKELMHLVTHDVEVCNALEKGYQSFVEEVGIDNAIPCRIAPDLKMGASDGGRFALAGYPSSTLLAYEGKLMKPPNWHEETDDPQHLNWKTLRTAIGLYIHSLKELDKKEEDP
ncbi:MAG: M28 family peptidase [Asgard group archaeon]|nr:M28 family peptidase [Asgard group archaeon]